MVIYNDKRFQELVDGTITGDVVLQDGTERVRQYLFQNSQIISISCPQSLKVIEPYAFQNCPILAYANLQGVTTINQAAFQYSRRLKTVTFGEDLTTIDNSAFMDTGISGVLDLSHTKLNIIKTQGIYSTNITKIILPATLHSLEGSDTTYQGSLGMNYSLTEVIFLGYMNNLNSGTQACNAITMYDFSNNGSIIPTFMSRRLGFKQGATLTVKIPTGQLAAWQASPWASLNNGNVAFVEKAPTTIEDI